MSEGYFDVDAARKAGASDDDILNYLNHDRSYDTSAALQSGASKAQIIEYLANRPYPGNSAASAPQQPAMQQQNQGYRPWASADGINSVGGAAVGFGKNLLSSGGNFLGDAAQSLMHPIDTVTNMGKLAVGTMGNAAEVIAPGNSLNIPYKEHSMAFGDYFRNKYGGLDNILRSVYEDPVGVAADLSTLLTLGGGGAGVVSNSAKTAGALATAGKAMSAAGKTIDPAVLAVRGVTSAPTAIAGKTKLAERLYQSTVKPSLSRDNIPLVNRQVETGLREGIPVSYPPEPAPRCFTPCC